MRDLTTYENMDALAASIDPKWRDVLVSLWRRRLMDLPVTWHLPAVIMYTPPLWRDLIAVTMPNAATLNRWERDHGYVSR